ncbi:MAG: hypothetical protein K8S16_07035 [Bacteroidales bacterium]|nr:hypothetical protein [Bacteroidales bacterium]
MFKNIFIILGLILLVTSGYAQDGWNLQDSGTDRDVICVHFIARQAAIVIERG